MWKFRRSRKILLGFVWARFIVKDATIIRIRRHLDETVPKKLGLERRTVSLRLARRLQPIHNNTTIAFDNAHGEFSLGNCVN